MPANEDLGESTYPTVLYCNDCCTSTANPSIHLESMGSERQVISASYPEPTLDCDWGAAAAL